MRPSGGRATAEAIPGAQLVIDRRHGARPAAGAVAAADRRHHAERGPGRAGLQGRAERSRRGGLTLRILSWNVAGRVEKRPLQAQVVAATESDVVCLQEITPSTLWPWRDALREMGLEHVRSSMDDWIPGQPTPDGRRLGVVTAANRPLATVTSAFVPWPERLLSTRVEDRLVIHNLHSPISQREGLVKVKTHEALYGFLAARPELPQVLVGDLNTPRKEKPDGTTWTFARAATGKLRLDRGERWDEAELALIRRLEEHGMRDVFRELHGFERTEISWRVGPQQLPARPRDRVDELEATLCEYLHEPREAGLSDHSPMLAEFELP